MPAPTPTHDNRQPRPPVTDRLRSRWWAVAAGAALATGSAGVVVPVATAPAASADTVAFCKDLISKAESYLDALPEPGEEEVTTQGEDYTWDDTASDILGDMKGAHKDEFATYRDAWLEEPAGTEHHAKWAYRDYYQQRLSEITEWEQGGKVGPRPADPVEWKSYKPHYQAWAVSVQELDAYEKSALRSLPVSADLGDWACPPLEQRKDNPNRPTAFSESQRQTIRTMTGNTLGKDLEQRIEQDRRAGYKTHVVTRAKPTPSLADALRARGASTSTHQVRGLPSNPQPSSTSAMKPGGTRTTSVVESMAQRSGKNPAQAAEGRNITQRLAQNSPRGTMPRSPGGIDWTSLELTYVTDDPKNDDYGYAFSADELPEDAEEPGHGGEASLNLSSDALFTWLALDPSQFWVNLNPDTPETIIDEQFASTDAGRVLLEADLAMKKTLTDLMDPETETGKEFWDSIPRSDEGLICYGWSRAWIEPQPAKVRADGDQLHILDAPLQVQIEPMDIDWSPPGDDPCADLPDEFLEQNAEYYAETFEPLLEERVNADPEYADMRRVYTARVAAEWIRDRDAKRPGAFHDVIGSGDVSDWPARTDWDPQDVFDELMELLQTPQYRYEYEHGEQELWIEVNGGIELPDAPRDQTSEEEFERDHPDRGRTVQAARFDAVSEPPAVGAQDDVTTLDDEETGTAWLGGGTFADAPGEPGPDDPPGDDDGGDDPGDDRPGDGDGDGSGDGDSPENGDGSGGGANDDAPGGGGREPLPPRADNAPSDVVPSSGPMPATGFGDVWMVYAALALVLAGLTLVLARRRWSSRA